MSTDKINRVPQPLYCKPMEIVYDKDKEPIGKKCGVCGETYNGPNLFRCGDCLNTFNNTMWTIGQSVRRVLKGNNKQ